MSAMELTNESEGIARLKLADRLFVLGGNPYFKRYANDFPASSDSTNIWMDTTLQLRVTRKPLRRPDRTEGH